MIKRFSILILLLALMATALACSLGGDDEDAVAPIQPPVDVAEPIVELTAAPPVPGLQVEVETAGRPADEMEMVLIPAGEFIMGDDESAFRSEKPQHLVRLDEYWIDRTEVTNAQYRLCVEADVCAESKAWSEPTLSGDSQPALVSWESAGDYCGWVGGRLPTEAEWEKAARGPGGFRWPWGNEFQEMLANLGGEEDGFLHTAPVGSFLDGVSPYGLYDMAGNASEWVSDWFDVDYYAHSPGSNPTGPAGGDQKVTRSTIANAGGGPEKCRTVARYGTQTHWEYGFRCASTTRPE